MTQRWPRIAFLDTNALLHMFGFWQTCDWTGIEMGGIQDINQLKLELERRNAPYIQAFRDPDFQSVTTGLKCFRALKMAKERYEFFSSQVCRSEMHRVTLSAHAHEGFHRNRVPLSLQQSKPLILYRTVLTNADYQTIDGKINQFYTVLKEDHEIDIKYIEDETNWDINLTEEILRTAQAIWSHMLIETMDAYIYSAAIAARADYFLTSDQALRATANNLWRPDNRWREVADRLRNMLESPDTKIPIRFPQGFGVSITRLP